MKPALNPRQRRFRDEYLRCLNATHAAVYAGYSKKTARNIGSRLLANANIRQSIEHAMMASASSAGRVLKEASIIVEADPKEMFGEDGKMLHPKDMPESIRRAISSVKIDKGKIEVRFWSKTEAIAQMGKYRKVWADESGTPATVNVNVLVSDQDIARIIGSLVGRAQLSNGNGGGNGNGV